MFRHKGKNRTFSHNLRLATLLSFVAGIVNVSGVLAVKTLTTNVTGHFAFFAEELLLHNYSAALTFFVFTIFFLFGSFTSSFLSEYMLIISPKFSHVVPISIEILVLLSIGILGSQSDITNLSGKFIAFSMLFAMGIQNSLVTKISQSTVRTTHLTGLFTDLGIDLSQLFFYKKEVETKKLKTSIYLRLSIIIFFFVGCVSGGFIYQKIEMKTLIVAAFFLIIALFYDSIRFKYLVVRRKKMRR